MANLQTTCITGYLDLCQTTASPGTCGRIWYDTGTNELKYSYCGVGPTGTWSAGGATINGHKGASSAGVLNAALLWGGSPTPTATNSEEYNGTSWSSGGSLSTGKYDGAGSGTQNAGLSSHAYAFSGGCQFATEEYNGTSWSFGGAFTIEIYRAGSAGTQNAGLVFGGQQLGAPFTACTQATEEYNGSTWSGGGNLIQGRNSNRGSGTQNAGLTTGGEPSLSSIEEYNGSTWSSGATMIRSKKGHGQAGTQNDSVVYAGESPSFSQETATYDGITWASRALMTQNAGSNSCLRKLGNAGGGSSSGVLAAAGVCGPSTCTCVTEEFINPIEVQTCTL